MSRKRSSKVNRTNGFHGNQHRERGHADQQERISAQDENRQGGKRERKAPESPESFNILAAGMLKKMNREMSIAAADIGKSIADVVTPLLAAAASLPDMDLRMENITVHQDKRRTSFCFIHPTLGHDQDEDGGDDDCRDDDEEEERLYEYGD